MSKHKLNKTCIHLSRTLKMKLEGEPRPKKKVSERDDHQFVRAALRETHLEELRAFFLWWTHLVLQQKKPSKQPKKMVHVSAKTHCIVSHPLYQQITQGNFWTQRRFWNQKEEKQQGGSRVRQSGLILICGAWRALSNGQCWVVFPANAFIVSCNQLSVLGNFPNLETFSSDTVLGIPGFPEWAIKVEISVDPCCRHNMIWFDMVWYSQLFWQQRVIFWKGHFSLPYI